MGFIFYSNNLYVCPYANTTLFCLPQLCSKFWNQEVWGPWFFFSILFWLFGGPWKSIWMLGSFLCFWQKHWWDFGRHCIASVNFFYLIFKSFNTWTWVFFIFLEQFFVFSSVKVFCLLVKFIPLFYYKCYCKWNCFIFRLFLVYRNTSNFACLFCIL